MRELVQENASHPPASDPSAACKTSIIVPILNERDNISPLIAAIERALGREGWELIFVDDESSDGSSDLIKSIAAEDRRIRCICRIGRRGLSSAAIEGFLSSSAPFLVLMDGDLQHEENLLPIMVRMLEAGEADLVVGSRYVPGGSAAGLADSGRTWLSDWGGRFARLVLGTEVLDPMSGFFAIRREAFEQTVRKLSGQGFKLLADLLASNPDLRVREIPFVFRDRLAGESKLDSAVKLEYLMLLIDKSVGKYVPTTFILFSLVGTSGALVHMGILGLLLKGAGVPFAASQAIAALAAMTWNFLLNNLMTYRGSRLRGVAMVNGLLLFYLICGIGLGANVGVANFLFGEGQRWWVAGVLGAFVGVVWNYAVSKLFVWRKG